MSAVKIVRSPPSRCWMNWSREVFQRSIPMPPRPAILFISPDGGGQPFLRHSTVYRPWESRELSVFAACSVKFFISSFKPPCFRYVIFFPQTWKWIQTLKASKHIQGPGHRSAHRGRSKHLSEVWNTEIVPTENSHLSFFLFSLKKRKHPDLGSMLDQCAKSLLINKRIALDDGKPHPHERPLKLSWCWKQQGLGPFGIQKCCVRLLERND